MKINIDALEDILENVDTIERYQRNLVKGIADLRIEATKCLNQATDESQRNLLAAILRDLVEMDRAGLLNSSSVVIIHSMRTRLAQFINRALTS